MTEWWDGLLASFLGWTTSTPREEDSTQDEQAKTTIVMGGNDESDWNQAVACWKGRLSPVRGLTKRVQHLRQEGDWDCGMVCLEMALSWILSSSETTSLSKVSREALMRRIGTRSIWTIDLVLALDDLLLEQKQQHCSSYLFVTKSLECNASLQHLGYYQSAFDKDQTRITKALERLQERYRQQKRHDVLLQVQTFSMDWVVELVGLEDCVAIALVDHSILMTGAASNNTTNRTAKGTSSYVGHYILLLGVERGCLVIQNPASDQSLNRVPLHVFERAWLAHGTDQDIVFLAKQWNEQHSKSSFEEGVRASS